VSVWVVVEEAEPVSVVSRLPSRLTVADAVDSHVCEPLFDRDPDCDLEYAPVTGVQTPLYVCDSE
jgi:hypothetical protein